MPTIYSFCWLILAFALATVISLPQLIATASYKSIRHGRSAKDKCLVGNLSLKDLFFALGRPRRHVVDGVFHTEATAFVGFLGLLAAFFSRSWHQWAFLTLGCLLVMGRNTVMFRILNRFLFRTPSRFCYWIGLCLSFMAVSGLQGTTNEILILICLIQAWDLCINTSSLWPMEPYTERWDKPSRAFNTPLLRYLTGNPGRVSGLPFPGRQGHINHIRTLGYNGGFQLKWMHKFREDPNPNGSGAHDWFQLNEDGERLDNYGIRYAFSHRALNKMNPKWKETQIKHLYENMEAKEPPSWSQMASI